MTKDELEKIKTDIMSEFNDMYIKLVDELVAKIDVLESAVDVVDESEDFLDEYYCVYYDETIESGSVADNRLDIYDKEKYFLGNFYKTEEEAEQDRDNYIRFVNIRHKYIKLIERLDKNRNSTKYYSLYYNDIYDNIIESDSSFREQPKKLCCKNYDLFDDAIELIGEDDLKFMLARL